MSEGLDTTAHMLGRILAQLEEHTRQLKALFDKLDVIRQRGDETAGVAKEAYRLATEHHREIHEKIWPALDKYEAARNRVLGATTVAGAVSALVAAIVSAAAAYWGSHN